MIITIDGPAGSGKSTVAKKLAQNLGFYFLYTGLLYRAVAYIWLHKLGKTLQDVQDISLSHLNFISNISYEYQNGEPLIIYDKENITKYLYDMSLSAAASIMSAKKEVRTKLLDIQRNVAKKYDIVAEGRDCGSEIFPNADYKFFLTANVDIRAKRVFEDKKRGDIGIDFEKVKAELEKRDERDTKRKVAPLIIPKDAIIIDNSNLNEEQTLAKFVLHLKNLERPLNLK